MFAGATWAEKMADPDLIPWAATDIRVCGFH